MKKILIIGCLICALLIGTSCTDNNKNSVQKAVSSEKIDSHPTFESKDEKIQYNRKRVENTLENYKDEIVSIVKGGGEDFKIFGGVGSYSLDNSTIDEDFLEEHKDFENEMKLLLEESEIAVISLSSQGIEFLLESIEEGDKLAANLEYSFEDNYLELVEAQPSLKDVVEIIKLEPNYYFVSVDFEDKTVTSNNEQ